MATPSNAASGNAGPGRPGIARQVANAASSLASVVISNDSDDEDGYEGEREAPSPQTHKKPLPPTAAPQSHNPHQSTAQPPLNAFANVKPGQKPNGSQYNDAYAVHGQQPIRRQHHNRTETTDSLASSASKRYEDKNMRPFPTPGAKEARNPFEEDKSYEEIRLDEAEAKKKHWKRWGPYLSERQWVSAVELLERESSLDDHCSAPFYDH